MAYIPDEKIMLDIAFTYADLEYFLLVLVRITCFIYIAPFFGMTNTPNRVKIGLGIFLSVLIYGSVTRPEVVYNTLSEYAIIVMKEAITGFLVGFGAQLCTTVAMFAGHMVDTEIGLGMVNVMDVTTKQQMSINGSLYQNTFMLMLIASGMYRYLLQALVDTFTLIPVSRAIFDKDKMVSAFVTFMGDYIVIGFRIALPIFCTIILLNCILGILAKIAPQMNMFSVGIQLKVLTGLSVLLLTSFLLPGAADFIFTEMKKMTVLFIEGMM